MATRFPDGYRMPLLLLAGFRAAIDALHAQLAEEGFAEMRPAYGFAMQAIGPHGATSSEIAQRIGVTRQAMGKTIDAMEAHGLVQRVADPEDGRRKRVILTARGQRCLVRSGEILDDLVGAWAVEIGDERMHRLLDDLGTIAGATPLLDTQGWLDED